MPQLIDVAGVSIQPALVGAVIPFNGDDTKCHVYAGGPPVLVNATAAVVTAAVNAALAA